MVVERVKQVAQTTEAQGQQLHLVNLLVNLLPLWWSAVRQDHRHYVQHIKLRAQRHPASAEGGLLHVRVERPLLTMTARRPVPFWRHPLTSYVRALIGLSSSGYSLQFTTLLAKSEQGVPAQQVDVEWVFHHRFQVNPYSRSRCAVSRKGAPSCAKP